MPRKIVHRAAAYIRQSNEKQSNFSPRFQKDKILTYCQENNIAIAEHHIFFDGKTAKYWRDRKDLKRLIAAASRGEFDTLVMYRMDRFSRNHEHQIIIREQLKYYGVTIVTLDPDEHASGDSIADKIIQMVFSLLAELELKKITERTRDGLEERYRSGFLPVSRRPLYEYQWEDRTIIVHGKERIVPKAVYVLKEQVVHTDITGKRWTEPLVVEYIFELADRSISLRRISILLTELGIPSPDGKERWSHQSVVIVLKHPGYTGKHAANKRKFTYVEGEGWRKEDRPEEEWINLPESVIVPIVSCERYDRVQKRLEKNKQDAARNNPDPQATLLRSGVIKCAYCGANLTVHRDNTKHKIAYACPAWKRGLGECKGCSIISHVADAFAWEKIREVVKNPVLVEQKLLALQKKDIIQDDIDTLTRLIEELVPRMQNLIETIEESPKGEGRSVLVAHLGDLQTQKNSFEEQRDELRRKQLQSKETQKRIDKFRQWCSEKRLTIDEEEADYQHKRDAIDYLGITVKVYRADEHPRMIAEFNPEDIVSTYGSTF